MKCKNPAANLILPGNLLIILLRRAWRKFHVRPHFYLLFINTSKLSFLHDGTYLKKNVFCTAEQILYDFFMHILVGFF
jgi:hypothetical protein